MNLCLGPGRANWLNAAAALALSASIAGSATAAKPPPRIDESELLASGFKVLVATTTIQQERIKSLPPGQIRPMQRNGKKFFIYPDAPTKQSYDGRPKEYDAYLQLHPDSKLATREAVKSGNAYRAKQTEEMQKATARDLSDPYLGLSWNDLGW
jgi:hypothetical protein